MLSSSRSAYALATMIATLWLTGGFVGWSQAAAHNARQKSANPDSTLGKQTFASTCAGCHGLDGRGGDRAPNIADRPSVLRLSDLQIFHIIENGIPGTGMPAFHSLESSQIKSVIAYLRTLQGTKKTLVLPGDPARGKAIFFGKAGCSRCHMVTGEGGFIASDLSDYAHTHEVEQIRSVITTPNSRSKLITARVRGGEQYVGRVRNEDNFSIQLQTLDGAFHFLSKSDIESLESDSKTLMPSDYASTLSAAELNDVISYLMRVAGGAAAPKKANDWEE